jgi:hypothetical protein
MIYVSLNSDGGHFHLDRHNLISYLYSLGQLQASVNKLFDFARGEIEFDSDPLNWEDFRNAYANLRIEIDEMHISDEMNLEAFTKRAIARRSR